MNAGVATVPPNFLGRLAGRAVGAGPVIAPRLPSLFEMPDHRQEPFGSGWEESVETSERTIETAQNPATAPLFAPPRATSFQEAPDQRHMRPERQLPSAAEPAPAPPQRIVPPTLPPLPLIQQRLIVAEAPPVLAPRPRPGPSDDMGSAPPRSAILVDERPALPRPTRMQPEAREGAPAQRKAAAPRFEAVKAVRPGAVLPSLAPSPLPAIIKSAPMIMPAPARREMARADPAPPAAPVVNITIGRVEVRAHVSAPVASVPAPAPASAAPQSLDDYLKQREARR